MLVCVPLFMFFFRKYYVMHLLYEQGFLWKNEIYCRWCQDGRKQMSWYIWFVSVNFISWTWCRESECRCTLPLRRGEPIPSAKTKQHNNQAPSLTDVSLLAWNLHLLVYFTSTATLRVKKNTHGYMIKLLLSKLNDNRLFTACALKDKRNIKKCYLSFRRHNCMQTLTEVNVPLFESS